MLRYVKLFKDRIRAEAREEMYKQFYSLLI